MVAEVDTPDRSGGGEWFVFTLRAFQSFIPKILTKHLYHHNKTLRLYGTL